jgi:hypothetical protein
MYVHRHFDARGFWNFDSVFTPMNRGFPLLTAVGDAVGVAQDAVITRVNGNAGSPKEGRSASLRRPAGYGPDRAEGLNSL